ncbi:MAG: guanine deaminase [Gammaproteobacteria bacterium]|nr:guanine deaminase [Gammaproteobacteria bacterium]MBT6890748.1 guanine deaminase [Gammaproteobacteria bacterium]MBT7877034.1 guanine deaminase [Gammaproteobacteria bacterium]
MSNQAYRSRILHVTSTNPLRYEYLVDGVLLVEDGKIKDIGPAQRFLQAGFHLAVCQHDPDYLIVPGFIDTHVHSPQLDIIGSYGEQLLDWLNKYTFPAEARYADVTYAATSAVAFLDSLLDAGTTTSLVFATSHLHATDQLFEAADEKGMRLIAGKVLMDQNALPEILDTAVGGIADSETLIKKWHGAGRLGYGITPRFAGSSSVQQLQLAGELHKKYPDTWIQTHLSENRDEIDWVAQIHPDTSDYLNAYEKYELVGERSVFAHCIHLTESERGRLADAGGKVAFCPSSNMFLGSGLLDFEQLKRDGIDVSLATDIGAGTSLSMLRTMGDAYKVCQLRGYSLSAMEAFAMSTLGNAQCLHLDKYIGNFEVGKEADFLMLDPNATDLSSRRTGLSETIEDELFVMMTIGDERSVAATYVEGNLTR